MIAITVMLSETEVIAVIENAVAFMLLGGYILQSDLRFNSIIYIARGGHL